MGCKRQVHGLDEVIGEVSLVRLNGEKQSEYISSFTAFSKSPVFEDKSVPVEGRR